MRNTKDEALKLAKSWFEANTYGDEAVEVYEAIEQALAAQPAVQPVAILNHAHGVYAFRSVNLQGLPDGEYQVYTTPPAAQRQWVGLTDEELKDIELGCHKTLFGKIEAMQKVEAKLKEKNT